jgi:outer membrane lipoprotein SlyB
VNKLCIFVGTTAGGLIGGFLGDQFGFMTGIVLSGIGSIAGVYYGWKLAQKLDR